MSTPKSEVLSHKVTTSRRTYFLDVKQLTDGSRYLSIKERRNRGDGNVPEQRIIVAAEDLAQFREGLGQVNTFLQGPAPATSDRLSAIRRIHPRAYAPWTADDDDQLQVGFARGAKIEHLAAQLQRQPSAIRSRLKKLGLMPA